MKKIILLALLLSFTSCTKSDSKNKDSLSQIPDDAIAFFNWNTTSEAYQRFTKSKWDVININNLIDKFVQNADITIPGGTDEQEQRKQIQAKVEDGAKEVKEGLKKFGITSDGDLDPRVQSISLFVAPSKENILSVSLLADGKDMTSSFEYLKSLADKEISSKIKEPKFGN